MMFSLCILFTQNSRSTLLLEIEFNLCRYMWACDVNGEFLFLVYYCLAEIVQRIFRQSNNKHTTSAPYTELNVLRHCDSKVWRTGLANTWLTTSKTESRNQCYSNTIPNHNPNHNPNLGFLSMSHRTNFPAWLWNDCQASFQLVITVMEVTSNHTATPEAN